MKAQTTAPDIAARPVELLTEEEAKGELARLAIEIGVEKNTTIVLPIPIELIAPILDARGKSTSEFTPVAPAAKLPEGSKSG